MGHGATLRPGCRLGIQYWLGGADRAPERRSGRRSWLHLDLYTNNKEDEVERLIALGATRYPWRYRPDNDFIVLEDPDGNLFCVVQITGTTSS